MKRDNPNGMNEDEGHVLRHVFPYEKHPRNRYFIHWN